MNKRICTIDGCDRTLYARGWCNMHYQRWKAHGDPLTVKRRVWGRDAVRKGECICWPYSITTAGYGTVSINGIKKSAHRHAYEEAKGDIPPGMLVDHICHERTCITPDHLRLATRQQNNANRSGATVKSSTGVRGVYPYGDRYKAGVKSNGVLRWYGTFDSIEEASRVATRERARLFGDFAGRD